MPDWRDAMPRAKTTLVYTNFSGIAVADHEAERTARALKEIPLAVSTENVIHAFRLLIQRGFFTHDEVDVFFERKAGEFLPVIFDKDGRTNDWYIGFCDVNDKVLQGLLGWDEWDKTPGGDKYDMEG